MEKDYKGFHIRQVGLSFKHFKDFEVWPLNNPEQIELWEDMTLDQVENMIDCIVN